MSLAARESEEEAARKEMVFAKRKREEDAIKKDLHYHRLITENMKLKDALRMAKSDIEDWVYSKGESPESTKVIELINTLI